MSKIIRPWGSFETLITNSKCTVKVMRIKAGQRTSLQYHKKRNEFFKLLVGECKIHVGGRFITPFKDNLVQIPKGKIHRISAITDTILLEISTGDFNENDIVRLQDDYGR